jgi:hypothetical protein
MLFKRLDAGPGSGDAVLRCHRATPRCAAVPCRALPALSPGLSPFLLDPGALQLCEGFCTVPFVHKRRPLDSEPLAPGTTTGSQTQQQQQQQQQQTAPVRFCTSEATGVCGIPSPVTVQLSLRVIKEICSEAILVTSSQPSNRPACRRGCWSWKLAMKARCAGRQKKLPQSRKRGLVQQRRHRLFGLL